MSFSYDLSTNVGKVRNLIRDVVQSTAILTDEEISANLTMKGNDIYATAALCCRSIATAKSLVAKMRKAGNYSEDSRSIYQAYLDLAKQYEEQALSVPADGNAEVICTDFNYRELVQDKVHRNEALDTD